MSQPPAPASPPSAVSPPSPPTVTGIQTGAGVQIDTRPLTSADVSALRAKRSELSNQLTSAQRRRDEMVRQLRSSPGGVAREGIESRLTVLDARIVQLETEIAANGRELARAPLELAAAESAEPRYGPFSSGQLTGITIVGTVTVLMPLAIAVARLLFKRASVAKPAPQVLESAARLERMEQAIDAMAVEIERISEGQRFVTQLMAPRPDAGAALKAGAAAEPAMAEMAGQRRS
ncbi:MAG: hypothetical protein LCH84_03430 [Gemmatimonadetes bacterium]|nr:hypothetical protein [Gemmatimonadota bacterium]